MKDFYIKVAEQLQKKLPFVIYNKPKSNSLIGLFQKNDKVYFAEDFNETGFVFAPFNGKKVILIPKDNSDVVIADYLSQETSSPLQVISEPDYGKTAFENLVAKGISAIKNHQFKKVVLSRQQKISVPGFDVIGTFKNLVQTYPTAFTYCFFHPETGMWFGASPEQLLKVKTNQFETIALAGTQKFEGNEDVSWESKEKEEQQFVTDFILENLENMTSDIAFSNPYTYKAGNLLHIKTDISGTLNDASNIRQLLDILHPTPAVCGLPKEAAMQFILDNEGYDRKYYSGYLGELNANFPAGQHTTDLYVNLRCMEIDESSAFLYIGCGVTKDSNPEKEYIETVNKAMTIKRIML